MTDARCLCGETGLKVGSVADTFNACHCDMCKKWGGIWVAVECKNVELQGRDNIGVYNSSDFAERGFCKLCGTHLYYKIKDHISYFVPVGLFSTDTAFTFLRQIFFDRKPDYYSFANETEKMTEEETFKWFRGADT